MAKILNISEALTIGIHSMGIISKSKKPVNAKSIAEITGFSKNHISKILQQLAKNDFLVSSRGPSGGYLLKRDAETINLFDIYKLFEGDIRTDYCKHECINCPFNKCVFDQIVENISNQFKEYLIKKKVSQL